jgi:hypothetical protein
MNFSRLIATAEFCVIVLATISCAVLSVLLLWAWWRSAKFTFLLLAFAELAFLYVNAFTGIVFCAQLFHTFLLPPVVFDPLYAGQALFGFIGTVVGFVATVALVRLALIACSRSTPNQTMEPTATAGNSEDKSR